MESNCCGATEWVEGTEICSACGEHAEFGEYEEESFDDIKNILSALEKYEKISIEATNLLNDPTMIVNNKDMIDSYIEQGDSIKKIDRIKDMIADQVNSHGDRVPQINYLLERLKLELNKK